MNDQQLLERAVHAALQGGKEVLEVYGEDFAVETKADSSPLTLADKNAHQAISRILKTTGLPMLSEEGKDIPFAERSKWNKYWLVDPLDGTKEFVKRNGEFTVNIALIASDRPVMGVIFVPVTGVLYFASKSTGAFKTTYNGNFSVAKGELLKHSTSLPIKSSREIFTVVASKSHLSEETVRYIEQLRSSKPALDFVSIGSSLKLCLIAEGRADLYPRFGPTMEWDTAAGHAIVEISGGYVHEATKNKPLLYNKERLLNPSFIAGR